MSVPKQATTEVQKELTDIINDNPTKIVLDNGKTIQLGWLRPDTQDKLNDLVTNYEVFKKSITPQDGEKADPKALNKGNRATRRFYAQSVAAMLLNNYWGLRLFWWIKWRWLYYFSDWNAKDYLKVITESKKKAQEPEYFLAMALLMDMTTMTTIMTKKEAEEYRQELELVKEHQSLKNSQP